MVSIIIPVYNCEKYLSNCITTVLNQTYSDIELILVDDGSTDSSLDICNTAKRHDARVKVIHQENRGAAAARKEGVRRAAGDYVCFVDADDEAGCDLVSNLVKYSDGVDLVTAGCIREEKNGRTNIRLDKLDEGYYSEDRIDYVWDNMIYEGEDCSKEGILPYVYSKLYRRLLLEELLNEVSFNLSIYEDLAINLCYLIKCKAIYVTKETNYIYKYRNESIMHKNHSDYLATVNSFYDTVSTFFIKYSKQKINEKLQKIVSMRMYSSGRFMGFKWNERIIRYVLPYSPIREASRVILYGAGNVGEDYYRQLVKQPLCEQIYWIDANWSNQKKGDKQLISPDRISELEYDLIIIAVKDAGDAGDIRHLLLEKNVLNEKIWWERPIDLSEL